jgi:hypothetical protein
MVRGVGAGCTAPRSPAKSRRSSRAGPRPGAWVGAPAPGKDAAAPAQLFGPSIRKILRKVSRQYFFVLSKGFEILCTGTLQGNKSEICVA